MDYDGYNVKQVTRNGSISLNPVDSPDGKEIIFTSYQNGKLDLYLKNLHTGKELMISSRTGLNITGDWSPRPPHSSRERITAPINPPLRQQ